MIFCYNSNTDQTNISAKGDMQSHLASCLLRTGKISHAADTIEESLKNIDAGWDTERDPHRSIWKSKALAVRSLINFNMGNLDEAKELANKSLQIAKSVDATSRIRQVEELIKFLNEN